MNNLSETEKEHLKKIKEIVQHWNLEPTLQKTLLEKIETSQAEIGGSFREFLAAICPDQRIKLKFQEVNLVFFERLREERWAIIFRLLSQMRGETNDKKLIRRIDHAVMYLHNKHAAG